MTVADLCTAALSRLGVPGIGQTPRAEDLAVAFDRLNQWIDGLQTERLTIYQTFRSLFTISAKADYLIGPGGDCNIARPTFIQSVNFINNAVSPALELPLGNLLTDQAYAAIGLKTLTAPYPQFAYYNPTVTTGTLSLWPIPTSSNLQGVIYVPTAVPQFGAQGDVVTLPPGYVRFLRDGLAVELAPEMGKPLDPALVQSALDARAGIKRLNEELSDMMIDPALTTQGRLYNMLTDGY